MTGDRHILRPLVSGEKDRGFRLEIDEFIADNEMTNLFLVALSEMQKNSLRTLENGEPDWLTYYSLASIHGFPRDEWNDYPNTEVEGYCHHSLNTFPTWHRPYMLLFESAVHQEMVKQANLYQGNEKETYLAAAARFRLPYWDILMPRNRDPKLGQDGKRDWRTIWACPQLLKVKTVFVRLPRGDAEKDHGGFSEIKNPLASFTFPTPEEFEKLTKGEFEKVTKRNQLTYNDKDHFNPKQTARVPTEKSIGETDDDAVDLAIQRQAVATATSLWQLMHPTKKEKPLYENETLIELNKIKGLPDEHRSWGLFANNLHVDKPPEKKKVDGSYQHAQEEDERTGENPPTHKYALVSLESFHDGIHDLLGTGLRLDEKEGDTLYTGQMGDPKYAAFDPIFWMHHNNIERLLCLQQALHPEEWTSGEENEKELVPFMTGNDKACYKSDAPLIKNYWSSGFSIPGEKPFPEILEDPAALGLQKCIAKYLTSTYYWATTLGPGGEPVIPSDWPKTNNILASWALYGRRAIENPNPYLHMSVITLKDPKAGIAVRDLKIRDGSVVYEDTIETEELLKDVQTIHSRLPKGALLRGVSEQGPSVQVTWNAHIRVRKFAFDGSFSVHLFLGHVNDHRSGSYMTDERQAGFMGVFVSKEDAQCASCNTLKEKDVIVEDVVPLTTILYDYLKAPQDGQTTSTQHADSHTIPNMTPAVVVPFLKEHLQWRMIKLNSQLIRGQEQHAKLEVTVTARQYLAPTEEHLMGVYGPYTAYPEITESRPGGAGYPPPVSLYAANGDSQHSETA